MMKHPLKTMSERDTLYTKDQADGDAFVQRAADLLLLLAANPVRGPASASPTAGMNIAQRILHVGGRNNEAGYVEFGSIQAVEALVRQVIRDLPVPQPSTPARQEPARKVSE